MAERRKFHVDADVLAAEVPAPRSDVARLLAIIPGQPDALSPLAGRRLLVTIAQPTRGTETGSLADDMTFEEALSFATHRISLK